MLEELKERGFYQQSTHPEEMAERLEKDRACCYIGFDPTADSMHVGHLIPLMGLAHMQRGGHRIIALMGGGTAMIGDPSGKTEIRKMLTEEQLQSNIQGMLPQFESFLDFSKDSLLVNNAEWLRDLNYIDFQRDIGRHFSVNRMLSFETYKLRLYPLSIGRAGAYGIETRCCGLVGFWNIRHSAFCSPEILATHRFFPISENDLVLLT